MPTCLLRSGQMFFLTDTTSWLLFFALKNGILRSNILVRPFRRAIQVSITSPDCTSYHFLALLVSRLDAANNVAASVAPCISATLSILLVHVTTFSSSDPPNFGIWAASYLIGHPAPPSSNLGAGDGLVDGVSVDDLSTISPERTTGLVSCWLDSAVSSRRAAVKDSTNLVNCWSISCCWAWISIVTADNACRNREAVIGASSARSSDPLTTPPSVESLLHEILREDLP